MTSPKKAKVSPLFLHYYKDDSSLATKANHKLSLNQRPSGVERGEWCYNVQLLKDMSPAEESKLRWILMETFEASSLLRLDKSSLAGQVVVEVGPRLCFSTSWSSNAQAVLDSAGLGDVVGRIERSRRYVVINQDVVDSLYDRMTEEIYLQPLQSFVQVGAGRATTQIVKLEPNPIEALKIVSKDLGLSFDDWDCQYYADLFRNEMKRDPTDVELFDLAQSNSEHSRHWFFGGNMVLDGVEQNKTLFQMVKSTIEGEAQRSNSVIAFRDNSSAIVGVENIILVPQTVGGPSRFVATKKILHPTFTAETHNFPTGVCPFAGAETGTGGRIRDVQCVGRGARVVAGTAAYCVGQLRFPNSRDALPWETEVDFEYPSNLATPLTIEIDASNGASDYGNKFGEPVIAGFSRSFGMRLPSGERREWIKPVMFTSGIGYMDADHSIKGHAEKGMIIAKIGGPAFRIGMGGGAASSRVQAAGDAKAAALDFDAVQRGDAEMENKMNRVVRACVELGENNPIHSIHDQGAGGNGNVLKEICEPSGGVVYLGKLVTGDETMSARELWTAEYQENNAMLIRPESKELFEKLCKRERSPFAFVGHVTDSGRVVVKDGVDDNAPTVVDFNLERVLGKLPPKTYHSTHEVKNLAAFKAPADATLEQATHRVLSLLAVGSKRFLTNKVDRCVTGLVAQQQCVGPLHTPLADVAVLAQSFFQTTGVATCTGEQPIKGLVDAKRGARMSVAEALSNLVWAKVTKLSDVKCRGNWMWPAKLPGEACEMFDACEALCDTLKSVGVAMDGGKDSLSMAASIPGKDGVVKAPGQVCVSMYCVVPDITLTVTPDLKPSPSGSSILLLCEPSSRTRRVGAQGRLGGSALAQVYSQLSNDCPDLEDNASFVAAFNVVQTLVQERLLLAGHDRSDGGLISCVFEMAFAGNYGVELNVSTGEEKSTSSLDAVLRTLFGEELGFVMQVEEENSAEVLAAFANENIVCFPIGKCFGDEDRETVRVVVDGQQVLQGKVAEFRDVWESTSFALERRQCNEVCVASERESLMTRRDPPYSLSFLPEENAELMNPMRSPAGKPKIAILREEGSNGDREMAGAFYAADFDVWDITMDDLAKGRMGLETFRGIAFVGGFSFADVFGSAKGWAAGARFNEKVKTEFSRFKARNDTFSLGICNGCQLSALLGWVPGDLTPEQEMSQPRFVHNASGRFESRFVTVKIMENSPSMLLKDMGGSVLGVWVAHGEGQAIFPDKKVLDRIEANGLAPIRYVDDMAQITTRYPDNPNGSVNGIAALCSPDGRHLAFMPHPERCFRMFQWPWMPAAWKSEISSSPWMRLFQNARVFCENGDA